MNSSHRTRSNRNPGEAKTADDLTRRNISTIVRCERTARQDRKKAEIIAEKITRFCGSSPFVWVHLVWFTGWILLNLLLPAAWRWDPIPFPFLTLIVSLEAIFLSTFILITENREAAVAERRAQLDLQINLLAEQESTKMLKLLETIAEKLGVASQHDPEIKALEEKTEPAKLLHQIDQSFHKPANPGTRENKRRGQ